jgi:benzil reductase ((S)-benzoin forming)
VIIITGGGRGIGKALALRLASQNEKVLIIGRNIDPLMKVQNEYPEKIQCLKADIGTPKGRASLIDYLKDQKAIKAIIHNAGTIEPITPLKNLKEADLDKVMEINLKAPLFLTQALLPKLKGARVLHISSGAAHIPFSSWGAYCMSKASLHMLYQCFKEEISEVAFGSAMPGIVDSNMQGVIRKSDTMPEEKLNFFKDLKRDGALVSCDVVARFLSWLLLVVDAEKFSESEWDIYDASHHKYWLDGEKAPVLGILKT